MKAVQQTIRLLVILLFINRARCQDGYGDILRLQQIASNDGQIESNSNYGNNFMQRDQSVQPLSQNYQLTDESDKNDAYNRADRRNKKIYRIKDPFQRQIGDDGQQQENNAGTQDSDPGASNQYAAMQYSLPPEEFLQQMRENPFFQQHQQVQQVSTPAPNMGYTATPQPPYQYSTMTSSGYDNSQQQQESKISNAQNYRSFSNSYQYAGNSFLDPLQQSTPSPIPSYVSTPNNQFVGTSSYVSSSSPIFVSTQPNLQYVSSSMSAMQAGSPDYNNKVTSTISSNTLNYDNNEQIKKMQIDHYDNSANGIRYPINVQQYQNDYPTSTPSPSSTAYPDQWQNNMNAGSKSRQDMAMPQYQNYPYNRNPQDNRVDNAIENEQQRAGNVAAANNLYLNYVQPDYQVLANLRNRQREVEQETAQPEYYSHGDYGWKLGGGDKKPLVQVQPSYAAANNYPRYQTLSPQPEGVAVSQMSFHMDTGKQQSYNHISKSAPDTSDPQEFAKAAAKAHENMKQKQLYENVLNYYHQNNPQFGSPTVNNLYNDKYRNKFYSESSTSSPYYYGPQQDLITVPPYYYANSRENSLDDKPKLPFDHDKALKNIVPIDVSNVVGENQQKSVFDGNTRFNYNFKDQNEQAAKQNYKLIADSFYQDKNAVYGFNLKPKAEEITTDGMKLLESNYYNKAQTPEHHYYQGSYMDSKRFSEGAPQQASYIPQSASNYQDSIQSPANIQQQNQQRPQQQQQPTDISSILKLNDIPYRLTQNLPTESYRMHSGNYEPVGLPSPLPIRLNQNVGNHQLDASTDILNRLVFNKHQAMNMHRPDNDPQSGLISTMHGFKVANPYNVDLKLVADVLKGKQSIDDGQIAGLRDQFNKPPFKLDFSQLQQLMAANGNLAQLTDGLGAYSSPYIDIYNGRYPYTGVKYSRSQEEEESIVPIADASNTHPIGAVIEQDEGQVSETGSATDVTGHDEDTVGTVTGFGKNRPKASYSSSHRGIGDKRHPNSLSSRHHYHRKLPKSGNLEPYPLLKPPPPRNLSRSKGFSSQRHPNRRRRIRRPKVHVFKKEPLFEAESNESEDSAEPEVPILLRPPPIAESKSDKFLEDKEKSS